MRAVLVLALLPFVIAGCAGTQDADPPTADSGSAAAAAPEPVAIHETVPLIEGGDATWTFRVEPGATTVEMRFFVTGAAVAVTGLPICLTIETPGQDATQVCQSANANVVVSPSQLVVNERVFYESSGAGAPVGTYTFTLNSAPSATDFHALVNVSYD